MILWRNGIKTDLGAGSAIAVNRNQQVLVHAGGEVVIWDLRTSPMTVTPIGSLGGIATSASDLNDLGQVVGASQNAAGVSRPFLWTPRKGMADLGTLAPGVAGLAAAITNAGQIVGYSRVQGTVTHATYWYKGKVNDLGVLPGYETSNAQGLNEVGQVVGYSSASNNTRATLWTLNVK